MDDHSFERLPGESAEAFRAFALYRDLGAKRSLLAVTRQLADQSNADAGATIVVLPEGYDPALSGPSGVPTERQIRQKSGRVSTWSRKWAWVERARAWDEHLDRAILRRTLSTVEDMAARHARQNEQVLGVMMLPFVELAKAIREEGRNDLKTMKASKLLKAALYGARYFDRLQNAERNARGVKVISLNDPDSGTQAPPEFRVQVHQPERAETDDDTDRETSRETSIPPAFGDRTAEDDEDDDE